MKHLSSFLIKFYLGKIKKEFNIKIFKTIDSTSTYLKNNKEFYSDKTVVIAESQTKGRGRTGRDFHSPSDNGIYMSILLKKHSVNDPTLLTVGAAVSVIKAIRNTVGIETSVKWVNDIFLDNKKICGILSELSGDDIIIGIGINLKSIEKFPGELKDVAGALGVNISVRNKLIASLIKEIKNNIICGNINETLKFYKEKSLVLKNTISFEKDGKDYTGFVRDINEKGNLIVETDCGKELIINSGEIRISYNNIIKNDENTRLN